MIILCFGHTSPHSTVLRLGALNRIITFVYGVFRPVSCCESSSYILRHIRSQQILHNILTEEHKDRSSHPEMLCQKGVLKNVAKFPGKHLCQGFFFNTFCRPEVCNFIKKRFWHSCFPVNLVKFLRAPFYGTPPMATSVKRHIQGCINVYDGIFCKNS